MNSNICSALRAKKKPGAGSTACWSRHCPSCWPTRLADGLELEVFYRRSYLRSSDSPRLCLRKVLVPPRSFRTNAMQQNLGRHLNCQRGDITPGQYLDQPRCYCDSSTDMHDGSALRIFLCLPQYFVSDRRSIPFAKSNVLHQIRKRIALTPAKVHMWKFPSFIPQE